MEERSAAISLLRQQERSLSLLKQQHKQQQGVLRQQKQDDLLTQCATERTKGCGSDLLFMDLYMRPTRSIGALLALFPRHMCLSELEGRPPQPLGSRSDQLRTSVLCSARCAGRVAARGAPPFDPD